MIGLYIDGLAEEGQFRAIDRIIEAQAWRAEAFVYPDGARCLLGHALDYHLRSMNDAYGSPADEEADQAHYRVCAQMQFATIGTRFDDLVFRFGFDRTVRAIKQRAGRHTRVNVASTDSAVQRVAC